MSRESEQLVMDLRHDGYEVTVYPVCNVAVPVQIGSHTGHWSCWRPVGERCEWHRQYGTYPAGCRNQLAGESGDTL